MLLMKKHHTLHLSLEQTVTNHSKSRPPRSKSVTKPLDDINQNANIKSASCLDFWNVPIDDEITLYVNKTLKVKPIDLDKLLLVV